MMTETDLLVRRGLIELLPRLRRFALVLTGNQADADDLTQAGIERALERTHQYRPAYKLETWIYKIMQNMWIDQMRKAGRRGPHVDIEHAVQTVGEDGRKTLEVSDMLSHVRAAIETLPEDQRAVVGLVLVDGQSYKDAADILGTPVGTIMSRLSRARQKIMASVGATSLSSENGL